MRVGIDINRLCYPDRSGLYVHVIGILEGIRQAGLQRWTDLFLFRASVRSILPSAMPHLAGFRVREFWDPKMFWRLRMRYGRLARQDVFQVFDCPSYPTQPHQVKAFLIPDLTVVHLPECHTEQNRLFWNSMFEQISNRADLVVTYSEHTRRDAVATLGLSAGRVVAVPLGHNPEFRPLPEGRVASALTALGLGYKRYLLTVGTIEPRKNHVQLFRAYAALKARERVVDIPLVVVGAKGWGYEPILAEVERLGLSDSVRFLGFVEDLPALYNGAIALAYPSRFEGFGLPPLEAMACGTPVVVSDATSLPEVVGDAGILVPPDDDARLAEALDLVIHEPAVRSRLAVAGQERAGEFTWKKCAERMFDAYRRASAAHGDTAPTPA